MRKNKKYVIMISVIIVIVIILLKIFCNSNLFITTQKMFPTETPFVTIKIPKPIASDLPEPTVTKILELTVTNTPKPTVTKILEPTITNTPKPTVTKVLESTVTNTPKPTVTKVLEPTVTNTPKPTVTKVPKLTVTDTPKPVATGTPVVEKKDNEPDLLESLSGKDVLFSTGDERTVSFNVRDYEAYASGNIGTYYIEYGCVDDEILVVSVKEGVNYIYTNFPQLDENSWYNFNTIGYDLTMKPLKEGTTQVYFRLYKDDACETLYDEINFTVKIEFIEESDFALEEYNPIASGYPYKEHEWQYGDDIKVSVWASKDRKRAVLVAKGTGEMWDSETARNHINTYTPWCYSDDCKYVQKIYEVHIGEGITYVEGFDSIAKLEVVTFSSTLKVIGDFAFKNGSFKELILPEGLEVIGNRAFLWCNQLENVILPSTLKYIGDNAFGLQAVPKEKSKNKLQEIVIPESVEFIGCYAFGYRYHMGIVLPEGLETSKFEKDWDLIEW